MCDRICRDDTPLTATNGANLAFLHFFIASFTRSFCGRLGRSRGAGQTTAAILLRRQLRLQPRSTTTATMTTHLTPDTEVNTSTTRLDCIHERASAKAECTPVCRGIAIDDRYRTEYLRREYHILMSNYVVNYLRIF